MQGCCMWGQQKKKDIKVKYQISILIYIIWYCGENPLSNFYNFWIHLYICHSRAFCMGSYVTWLKIGCELKALFICVRQPQISDTQI